MNIPWTISYEEPTVSIVNIASRRIEFFRRRCVAFSPCGIVVVNDLHLKESIQKEQTD